MNTKLASLPLAFPQIILYNYIDMEKYVEKFLWTASTSAMLK